MKLLEKLDNLSKHPSFYVFALGGFIPIWCFIPYFHHNGESPFGIMILYPFISLSICQLALITEVICMIYNYIITNELITKNIFLKIICWILNVLSIIFLCIIIYFYV